MFLVVFLSFLYLVGSVSSQSVYYGNITASATQTSTITRFKTIISSEPSSDESSFQAESPFTSTNKQEDTSFASSLKSLLLPTATVAFHATQSIAVISDGTSTTSLLSNSNSRKTLNTLNTFTTIFTPESSTIISDSMSNTSITIKEQDLLLTKSSLTTTWVPITTENSIGAQTTTVSPAQVVVSTVIIDNIATVYTTWCPLTLRSSSLYSATSKAVGSLSSSSFPAIPSLKTRLTASTTPTKSTAITILTASKGTTTSVNGFSATQSSLIMSDKGSSQSSQVLTTVATTTSDSPSVASFSASLLSSEIVSSITSLAKFPSTESSSFIPPSMITTQFSSSSKAVSYYTIDLYKTTTYTTEVCYNNDCTSMEVPTVLAYSTTSPAMATSTGIITNTNHNSLGKESTPTQIEPSFVTATFEPSPSSSGAGSISVSSTTTSSVLKPLTTTIRGTRTVISTWCPLTVDIKTTYYSTVTYSTEVCSNHVCTLSTMISTSPISIAKASTTLTTEVLPSSLASSSHGQLSAQISTMSTKSILLSSLRSSHEGTSTQISTISESSISTQSTTSEVLKMASTVVTTTVSGIRTVYTTWCPLSGHERVVTLTVGSCKGNICTTSTSLSTMRLSSGIESTNAVLTTVPVHDSEAVTAKSQGTTSILPSVTSTLQTTIVTKQGSTSTLENTEATDTIATLQRSTSSSKEKVLQSSKSTETTATATNKVPGTSLQHITATPTVQVSSSYKFSTESFTSPSSTSSLLSSLVTVTTTSNGLQTIYTTWCPLSTTIPTTVHSETSLHTTVISAASTSTQCQTCSISHIKPSTLQTFSTTSSIPHTISEFINAGATLQYNKIIGLLLVLLVV